MEVSSKISGLSRKNAEDYTTLEEILADVQSFTHENFILSQAVEVTERYLRKRSPNLLAGLGERMGPVGFIERMGTRDSHPPSARSISLSVSRDSVSQIVTRSSTSSSPALTSRSALHSSVATHRINMIYRVEMVEREIEDGRMQMDKLRKRFESSKFLSEAEEENLMAELEFLETSGRTFDTFIRETSDKKTGRLFHDKLIRFLETELNSTDRDLRKMKLKVKTHQTEYSRMKSQQQLKLELRERLHPVDLEKLLIENQEQLELLEQKTKQLLDLKKAIGMKGQNLVSTKSKLNDTNLSLKNIAQDLKQKETKFKFMKTKETQNINDLVSAELLNQSMKKLSSTYRSPDVQTYLRMEVRLDEMRREKEAWSRRCKYQRQTLTLLEHQVKQLAPPADIRTFRSFRSLRSGKSIFSSMSADSKLKKGMGDLFPITHCTPSTPMFL